MKKANKPQQIYGTGNAPMTKIKLDYKKAYEDQCSINRSLMQEHNALSSVSVSQSIYDKQVAENKAVAEQLTTERKNVELLKQQVHNKDTYIKRLHEGISILTLQLLKV